MASKLDVIITENHTDEVKEELRRRIADALEAVGTQAVGHAVENITSVGAVDTGLLRNSLTYALDGEKAKLSTYHASGGSNTHTVKGQTVRYSYRSNKAGAVAVGRYTGTAPAEAGTARAVYIGTNVYYAPYVEMGHKKRNGGSVPARPYLKPAVENYKAEYEAILQKVLSK